MSLSFSAIRIFDANSTDWRTLPEKGLTQSLTKRWQWWHLVILIIVSEVVRMYRMFLLRPKKVMVTGMPTVFGRSITGLIHMFSAQRMVSSAYNNRKGKMWAIPARDRFHVFVSSQDEIEEFSNASQQDISLQGAVHELFPPHELYGGMPAGDKIGNIGLSQAILRHSLRSNLPRLQPVIRDTMEKGFLQDFRSDNVDKNGFMKIPLHYTCYRMVARLNSLIMVGQELSSDRDFSKLLQRYLATATLVEELLRITPSFLKSIIGNLIMRSFGRLTKLHMKVLEVVKERALASTEKNSAKHFDCIQWSIERSRKASHHDLATHIIAMLFASTHQLPVLISFAIYRLCKHPEYLASLREEAERCSGKPHRTNNDEMPLLDSFLKEVARLHPITIVSEIVSMPHKVENSFTFSNGAHVPAGNWVCIPQQAILRDPSIYPSPLEFNGFRFVNWTKGSPPEYATSESRFSHPAHLFPYWGTIKQACPARFYVSMVAKMMIAHFITHYDAKLTNPSSPTDFNWGISSIPHPRLAVSVRERDQNLSETT